MKNHAASVRDRLLKLAKERKENFQFVLTRYGIERFLYRLSRCPHAGAFVLKGAQLFAIWSASPHRPTKDIDMLGTGAPDPERLAAVVREVLTTEVEEDGLTFELDSVGAERIRGGEEYEGVRITLRAHLAGARIPLQVDVGFGDAVTPGPVEAVFPTLLDHPAPRLATYPRETVVAEKFQAMVELGMANSRMKDFYDVMTLAQKFAFDGRLLGRAIRNTFERRKTDLPAGAPTALTPEFFEDRGKKVQWAAFVDRTRLQPGSLEHVAGRISEFLLPIIDALQAPSEFDRTWEPGGPWRERGST